MEYRKKKVLFLITKSNFGGAQRYVFDLATHIDRERYEPIVVTGGNGELVTRLREKNIHVHTVSDLTRDLGVLQEIKATIAIVKIIRAAAPDILHTNSSKAGLIGTLVGRMLRIPHIVFTAHGWAFSENRPFWQRWLFWILHWVTMAASHTTIVVSRATRDQFGRYAPRAMHLVHNGRTVPNFVDRSDARAHIIDKAPALRAHHEDFWSVTIGELHPIKQHHVTIEAMWQIVRALPNARHIIIGGGECYTELVEQTKHAGLTDHVFFTHNMSEAARYLHAFDLFILSSRSDTYPYVIAEACYAGLPIIASRVGGIPEMIQDHTEGVLVSSGDPSELARNYIAIAHDMNFRKRLAHGALTRASHFSVERMVQKTVDLYSSSA